MSCTYSLFLRCLALLFVTIGLFGAESNNIPLQFRISSEAVPSGGLAQIKLFLLNPQPIASGTIVFSFGRSIFASNAPLVTAATVFSAAGDAYGLANLSSFNPESLTVQFGSPSASVGRLADLPVVEFTILVNAPM